MIDQIKNTKAYKKLAPFQQSLLLKRDNRKKIEDAVITARAIGIDLWKNNNKLPNNWRGIVEELANETT